MRPGSSTMGKMRRPVSPIHKNSIPDPQMRPNLPHNSESTTTNLAHTLPNKPRPIGPRPESVPGPPKVFMVHTRRNDETNPRT